jgi:hypothetical protein
MHTCANLSARVFFERDEELKHGGCLHRGVRDLVLRVVLERVGDSASSSDASVLPSAAICAQRHVVSV